jgi:hypothetical protein
MRYSDDYRIRRSSASRKTPPSLAISTYATTLRRHHQDAIISLYRAQSRAVSHDIPRTVRFKGHALGIMVLFSIFLE